MDTLILTIIVTLWIGLVLPAVLLPFLPRNLETRVQPEPRTASRLSFLSPKGPEDASGGQAVA